MIENENPLDDVRFVEVFRARDTPHALMLKHLLEDHDIPVMVEGELLQGVVGELPMGWATSPRLLVDELQEETARELIRRHEVREIARGKTETLQGEGEDDEDRCLSCGAPMKEEDQNCSSCGWSYQA